MSIIKELQERSGDRCELCTSTQNLSIYTVHPYTKESIDHSILICPKCDTLINTQEHDPNHWRCLNDTMWSSVEAVKVIVWRLLNRMCSEGWPLDLLDMMYLDGETLEWAKTGEENEESSSLKHLDSYGVKLNTGDTVTLIKDLTVKGANFTAKRGTSVRNISLVQNNTEQIEGKVNNQQIVILTKFVKK